MRINKQECIEIGKERYPEWFNSFLSYTDEKQRMDYIFGELASNLYEHKVKECRVLDIGSGEGTLAEKMITGLRNKCESINYYGIEKLEEYVNSSTYRLQKLNVNIVEIKKGSFLEKKDLAMLPNNGDIIISSHVAYYSQNVTEFVNNLIGKSNKNSTLIFFHQSELSAVTQYRDKYKLLDIENSPSAKIESALKAAGFITKDLLYPSLIRFPNYVDVADILKDDEEVSLYFPSKIKYLLEFISHLPLECIKMQSEDSLLQYITDIRKFLINHDNNLIFWNVLQIATKQGYKEDADLKNKLEGLSIPDEYLTQKITGDSDTNDPKVDINILDRKLIKVSVGKLTPLEISCYEGNVEIFKRLLPQLAYSNVKTKQDRGFVGLNLAARNGHDEIVDRLLDLQDKFNINENLEGGFTALHLAAFNNHYNIVYNLLERGIGIEINKGDDAGATPLYLALSRGNKEIVSLLKERLENTRHLEDKHETNNDSKEKIDIADKDEAFIEIIKIKNMPFWKELPSSTSTSPDGYEQPEASVLLEIQTIELTLTKTMAEASSCIEGLLSRPYNSFYSSNAARNVNMVDTSYDQLLLDENNCNILAPTSNTVFSNKESELTMDNGLQKVFSLEQQADTRIINTSNDVHSDPKYTFESRYKDYNIFNQTNQFYSSADSKEVFEIENINEQNVTEIAGITEDALLGLCELSTDEFACPSM